MLASPNHRALAADKRRHIFELKLEAHRGAHRLRLFGANENATLAHVDGVAFNERFERFTLELDLERDLRALGWGGIH